MDKKTVVFGGSGVLGKEIVAQDRYNCFVSPPHSLVDIVNFKETCGFIKKEKPLQILHLAALVGARLCEEDKKKAYLVNVIGTENIAKICLNENIKLIYMSTDTVFDGNKGNYTEEDTPNPMNYYSLTKFAGECFAKTVPSHLIIRSSFLPKDDFPYARALIDQYTTRLPVDVLAGEILLAMEKDLEGIIHIGGERDTLYNLARKINSGVGKITIKETGLNLPRDLSLNSFKWGKIKNGA